jgi:hypothetical protein
MKTGARAYVVAVAAAGVLAWLSGVAFAQPAANEVLQWNDTTMKAIEANGQSNVVATRTLAMVQAAVHDALNAINRRYDAYYFEGPGDPAASPDAAVAAAAHTVLVGVVNSFGTPAQKGTALALVEQAYTASLARTTDGPARNKGVAVGRAAGAAMLALYARHGRGKVEATSEPRARESGHRQSRRRPWLLARRRSRLGECDTVHPALRLAILAPRTARPGQPYLCP